MKIKNTNETETLRGVEFPKGKAVTVEDADLIAKVLNIPGFVEVKARKAKSNDQDKE